MYANKSFYSLNYPNKLNYHFLLGSAYNKSATICILFLCFNRTGISTNLVSHACARASSSESENVERGEENFEREN